MNEENNSMGNSNMFDYIIQSLNEISENAAKESHEDKTFEINIKIRGNAEKVSVSKAFGFVEEIDIIVNEWFGGDEEIDLGVSADIHLE